MQVLGDHHIYLFLLQLFVVLLAACGLGALFRRLKLPAMTGELLAGILLGPTLLGRFCPGFYAALFPAEAVQTAMFETVAWIGVLFLLLDTGLEIDFSIAWRQRGAALTVALTDVVVPMLVAFLPLVLLLPDSLLVDPNRRLIFGMFMATVMTISAMPVSARCLHDLNLLKTELGFLTMSALAVNDILGWVIFSIILAIFMQATISLGSILMIFMATLGFAALVLSVGRQASIRVFDAVKARGFPEPGTSLTITLLLGLLFGAITQKLGVHALFGFFLAGVMVGEAKSLSEDTRRVINQMVYSLFVPLFFANIGLRIDFAANLNWPLVLGMCVVGIGGRYLGAWLGMTVARVPRVNRDLISIAHTPGGMMEIVVALLALDAHLITQPVFVAIVFSAVFSSILMGPWMLHSLSRRRHVSPMKFLDESAILVSGAGTRAGLLRALANRVADAAPTADETEIVRLAQRREDEFGTALGHGVAIPHIRLEKLRNPILAFAYSPKGVDWNAPDAAPVHYVFFMASTTGAEDVHVQTMAKITKAMARAANQAKLKAAETPEEMFAALHEILD